MTDAGTAQLVHQGGEVREGVAGAVIELHLLGGKPLPLLEDPVGVLGITAAAHHHRKSLPAGEVGSHQLPVLVTPEHQDHLGRRGLGPPPPSGEPQQRAAGKGQPPEPPGSPATPARP